MDPKTNAPVPSFDLPQPATPEVAQGVNPNVPAIETNQQTEQHNMELPAAAAPAPPPTQASAPVSAAPLPPANPVPIPAPVQPSVPLDDLSAEDNDLIEKAWVQKAKHIVEQTRNDPYKQNKEINKVKASYIKKRYNKDIKVTDEQTQ